MIFPRRAKLVDFAVCPMFSLFAVARFVCEKVANKLRKNGRKKRDCRIWKERHISSLLQKYLVNHFFDP